MSRGLGDVYKRQLLEEYINKVSERGGAYQKYIKDIEIPDTFNLHLDITKVRGLEADYEWSEADEEKYGTGKLC